MVGLTCCYVLLLKMVLIRAFVANPANVAITRFFCLFFTQKFTQKNRILAEFWQKFCLKNWPLEALPVSLEIGIKFDEIWTKQGLSATKIQILQQLNSADDRRHSRNHTTSSQERIGLLMGFGKDIGS